MQNIIASRSITSPNLKRLFVLRSLAIAAFIAISVIALFVLQISLPVLHMAVLIGALMLLNLYTWYRIKTRPDVSELEFFIQIIIDAVVLSLLLYFTGGSANPFVVLLIIPLIITAAAMRERYTWLMALLTVACYTGLMFYHKPLKYSEHAHEQEFAMHITGMWLGFVFSALIIAFFVVRISNTLREREQLLSQAREQTLRDERLVAVGTLAAGTAHEIGTPLSTIAIISKELEHEYQADESLVTQLKMLGDQVQRCKVALGTLAASAGQIRAESAEPETVDHFIEQTITQWQDMRPGLKVDCHLHGEQPAPKIVADQTLAQAIINVLNNAADASPNDIEVVGQWSKDKLILEISDRGQGLSTEIKGMVGDKIMSTKGSQGLGLGLFIAYTVIKRLGGSVHLYNRESGGVCARLELPLAMMKDDA